MNIKYYEYHVISCIQSCVENLATNYNYWVCFSWQRFDVAITFYVAITHTHTHTHTRARARICTDRANIVYTYICYTYLQAYIWKYIYSRLLFLLLLIEAEQVLQS